MIAITNPMSWIDKVVKLLDLLSKKENERILTRDEVNKKFREAIIETKIYVSQYKREQKRNHGKEEDLARIWFEAARLIQKDKEETFAEECNEMAFALLNKKLNDAFLEGKVNALYRQGKKQDYAMPVKGKPRNRFK